jgi:hypothetical protein
MEPRELQEQFQQYQDQQAQQERRAQQALVVEVPNRALKLAFQKMEHGHVHRVSIK